MTTLTSKTAIMIKVANDGYDISEGILKSFTDYVTAQREHYNVSYTQHAFTDEQDSTVTLYLMLSGTNHAGEWLHKICKNYHTPTCKLRVAMFHRYAENGVIEVLYTLRGQLVEYECEEDHYVLSNALDKFQMPKAESQGLPPPKATPIVPVATKILFPERYTVAIQKYIENRSANGNFTGQIDIAPLVDVPEGFNYKSDIYHDNKELLTQLWLFIKLDLITPTVDIQMKHGKIELSLFEVGGFGKAHNHIITNATLICTLDSVERTQPQIHVDPMGIEISMATWYARLSAKDFKLNEAKVLFGDLNYIQRIIAGKLNNGWLDSIYVTTYPDCVRFAYEGVVLEYNQLGFIVRTIHKERPTLNTLNYIVAMIANDDEETNMK